MTTKRTTPARPDEPRGAGSAPELLPATDGVADASPPAAPDAPRGAPHAPPLALRAPDAARALGVGVRHLWTLTKAGEIPHVRLGAATVYPVDALREWLDRKARASTRRGSK